MRRPLTAAAVLAALLGALPLPYATAQVLDAQAQCASEGSGNAPAKRASLRVASFNVLHTLTDESNETLDARLPLAVSAIISSGADVVGAQEVAVTTNHGHVAQRLAKGLAQRTHQRWYWCWFGSNPHFPGEPDLRPGGGGGALSDQMAAFARGGEDEFHEGVAVLSRYPIATSSVRRMPPRSYESPFCVPPDPINCNAAAIFDSRSILHTRINGPTGAVDVFTTHLAHGITPLSDTTKLLYAQLSVDYVDEMAGDDATPDFLTGDFNSVEGSPVHDAVTGAGFVDTFRKANPKGTGYTSDQQIFAPKATVDHRIDYVFARPGSCALRVTSSKVFANKPGPYKKGVVWPSDHLAVVSEIAACGAGAVVRPGGSNSAGPGGGPLAATGPSVLPLVAGFLACVGLALLRRYREE